jgi:hypothetical protein
MHGNAVMGGLGAPSRAKTGAPAGHLKLSHLDDVPFEPDVDARFTLSREDDGRSDHSQQVGRYLKLCHSVLTDPTYGPSTRFAILTRKNTLYALPSLDMLRDKLKESLLPDELAAFGKFNERVLVTTVHKFKGREADVVILLRVTQGDFPLLHPDNALFRFFGANDAQAFEDERRLYYVGITRPKSVLHVVSERGRESPFLRAEAFDPYEISEDDVRYLASKARPGMAEIRARGEWTYMIKETLKQRGYSWRPERKTWRRLLPVAEADAERRMLHTLVPRAADSDVTIEIR